VDEKVAKVRKAWETVAAIRNAKTFYCLLVKMEGARVNSSVTADRLLYFSVFRSFGLVMLAALAIS
jgi:hypothetical protein